MHVADVIRALDRFGPCLSQVYGQGETPMTITSLPKDAIGDRQHPAWPDRLASAGSARSVVEVLVAGADDAALPTGDLGEVLVRGDTVMRGYWDDEAATSAALRGGWLHTGDIGVMDQHGNLTLKDRSKDMIISGGLNVYPREVEEVLASVDGVREVSVIGRPDEEWGEVVVAYVCGDATADDLDRACLARIARYKRPRDYVFLDALPESNNGKILKTRLRELDIRGDRAASQP
jgi:long-chain acyl-CoA synthetase